MLPRSAGKGLSQHTPSRQNPTTQPAVCRQGPAPSTRPSAGRHPTCSPWQHHAGRPCSPSGHAGTSPPGRPGGAPGSQPAGDGSSPPGPAAQHAAVWVQPPCPPGEPHEAPRHPAPSRPGTPALRCGAHRHSFQCSCSLWLLARAYGINPQEDVVSVADNVFASWGAFCARQSAGWELPGA